MEAPRKKRRLDSQFDVRTLDDLIHLALNYKGNLYNWYTLWKLALPLSKLKKMVGMETLKKSVVDQVIYCIQDLHKKSGDIHDRELLHTVICGPPGCGKTTVSKILAEIYCALGILPTSKIVVAGKEDFIGPYIGQTEPKTMRVLNSALGGVLFIDEAYSLGYSGRSGTPDSFSKVIMDLLNRYLSEHQGEFICIIAGYREDLEKYFFSANKGLERRFPITYNIEGYSAKELLEIFIKKVEAGNWSLDQNAVNVGFFERNKKHFKYYGGDMEVLFGYCKRAHSRRIFGSSKERKVLTKKDLERGMTQFLKNNNRGQIDDEVIRRYFS